MLALPRPPHHSVVPATERLAADQAVGLVFAKYKAAQTILVLSKADQVTETLFERLVVPRLLGTDEETPRFGFAGCLATYCRDQAADGADKITLAETGPRESEWARKRLSSLRHAPDAIEKLRDNITVCGWAGRGKGSGAAAAAVLLSPWPFAGRKPSASAGADLLQPCVPASGGN